MGEACRGRAVVVGGSLTGLLAARVLIDHFAEVVLVERDRFPHGPDARKGVPQARHLHVLLTQGGRILGDYFPGLRDELVAAGSCPIDMARDARWRHFGGWKMRFASGMEMLSQSRAFLEWKVRARVAALPGVRVLDGQDVAGLAVEDGRVCGVRLGSREPEPATTELAADLVVDASGRGSRMPRWLEQSGYAAPDETEVRVDVGYASRFYRRPAGHGADWQALMIYPRPGGTRLGVLFPVEDDRWMVTLVGWFGDHPAADDESFLAFARSLDSSELYDAIRAVEPCSPVALHRFRSDRRRHYERLARLPDRLAVLGDAFCSFNPIYGQGMTTGALGARTLDRTLAGRHGGSGSLDGFAGRFHRALSRVIDSPWLLTTTEDLRSPLALGCRPRWLPLVHWYTARIHRLAWHDRAVGRRFLEVMHLTASPCVLLHPRVMLRALTAGRP